MDYALKLGRHIARNPRLAAELYFAASEIVDDFDDYGPFLQSNENGEYGSRTTIEKLRAARDAFIEIFRSSAG